MKRLLLIAAIFGSMLSLRADVETIVCVRHGEKTERELGQLSVQGLNRSLALPRVLIGKYGRPSLILAPNPSDMKSDGTGGEFSYVRPLATIEPTAIALGMPVDTRLGMNDLDGLERKLDEPPYANAVVFIAWEHSRLEDFVRHELAHHGGDPGQAPHWHGKDFDSIYVVRITRGPGGMSATFTLDHEGLDHPSAQLPAPAP